MVTWSGFRAFVGLAMSVRAFSARKKSEWVVFEMYVNLVFLNDFEIVMVGVLVVLRGVVECVWEECLEVIAFANRFVIYYVGVVFVNLCFFIIGVILCFESL